VQQENQELCVEVLSQTPPATLGLLLPHGLLAILRDWLKSSSEGATKNDAVAISLLKVSALFESVRGLSGL
jgi:hypothetical protein